MTYYITRYVFLYDQKGPQTALSGEQRASKILILVHTSHTVLVDFRNLVFLYSKEVSKVTLDKSKLEVWKRLVSETTFQFPLWTREIIQNY